MADVVGGRSAPMNEEQRKEAEKTLVGEFSDVKHVKGVLSMGRYCLLCEATDFFMVVICYFTVLVGIGKRVIWSKGSVSLGHKS